MKRHSQQILKHNLSPAHPMETVHQFGSNTARQRQIPSSHSSKQKSAPLSEGEFNNWDSSLEEGQDVLIVEISTTFKPYQSLGATKEKTVVSLI